MKNLDILRSAAVLSVLLAHSAPFLSFGTAVTREVLEGRIGRFGVLIFFVHTALVLMMSMSRISAQPGWMMRFYLQRAFRIYPLSVLCVVVVLVFQIPPILHSPFAWPSLGVLIANLALVQNFWPSSSISGPLWSLPFEVQMYALLPAIFWLVRKEKKNVYLLVAASLIIALMEKAFFPGSPWLAEFIPCFMGGIVAYTMLDRSPRFPAAAWPLLIGLLALACYASGLSTLCQWGACLLLGVSIPLFRDYKSPAISKVAALIAQYSYGIYLSHMPLRWLCFEKLHLSGELCWMFYLALVAIVSVVLYHAVESPMIRLGRRVSACSERVAKTTRPDACPGIGCVAPVEVA